MYKECTYFRVKLSYTFVLIEQIIFTMEKAKPTDGLFLTHWKRSEKTMYLKIHV